MRVTGVVGLVVLTAAFVSSASQALPQEDVAVVYQRNCGMCHGASGAGDGAAAASMNPRPTDFTSAEWQESRTDEQIATAIREGSGTMPGFGQRMSGEQITALTAYVRRLGEAHGTP